MENLLILQLGRLGDLVQTLPVVRRFKQEKPRCRITLVCLEAFQGILADCLECDRLVPVGLDDVASLCAPENQARFPYLPPFDHFPELREDYDLIVNLTSDSGSAVICEKVHSSVKRGRIHTYAGELRLLDPWSKYLFAMVSHRTENLFNLVDIQIGMAGLKPRPINPCLPVMPFRADEAHALLASRGRRGGGPLVALQAGASDLQRAWDLDRFADLARRLLDEGVCEIALLGDGAERERTDRLIGAIGRPVIDLVGATGLGQLPAVLKACDLLVSNDTGTIHVAAAVGTPTLGLFFSTAYFSETAPYGEGHCVLQVEIACSPCNASSRCPVQVCRDSLVTEAVHESVVWILEPYSPPPAIRPNLYLYRSRFLANGTLLYAPVHAGRASEQYQAGLLGRLLWEVSLGMPVDAAMEDSWRRFRVEEGCEQRRAGLARALTALEGPFAAGLESAGRLRKAFAEGNPDKDLILLLHGRLSHLGAAMAAPAKEAGLIGRILEYEMMDMDYVPYPALAVSLEDKYRKLGGWMASFREAMTRLTTV